MFGCILVLKSLRTEKTWTWVRSAVKSVKWGKSVTYHRNNTKPQSKKNAKQKNAAIAVNNLKERTQHMDIMQTASLAKVNFTIFYCIISL